MFKKKKNPKLCIIYNWFLTKVNHWFQWYTFNDFFGLQMYIIDYAALTKDPFYKKCHLNIVLHSLMYRCGRSPGSR